MSHAANCECLSCWAIHILTIMGRSDRLQFVAAMNSAPHPPSRTAWTHNDDVLFSRDYQEWLQTEGLA